MIEKTGYLLSTGKQERYIQIESLLIFFHERFISAGKHHIIEGEYNIGTISINEQVWSYSGLETLSDAEREELFDFIKHYQYTIKREIVQSFGLALELDNNLTYCEVLFKDGAYDICFDGKTVGRINQDENHQWIQTEGSTLSDLTVQTITNRLEEYYK
jgi:hypothetical protein